jgi:hypothetical protein
VNEKIFKQMYHKCKITSYIRVCTLENSKFTNKFIGLGCILGAVCVSHKSPTFETKVGTKHKLYAEYSPNNSNCYTLCNQFHQKIQCLASDFHILSHPKVQFYNRTPPLLIRGEKWPQNGQKWRFKGVHHKIFLAETLYVFV